MNAMERSILEALRVSLTMTREQRQLALEQIPEAIGNPEWIRHFLEVLFETADKINEKARGKAAT